MTEFKVGDYLVAKRQFESKELFKVDRIGRMIKILKKSLLLATLYVEALAFTIALDKLFSSGFSIYENAIFTIVFLFLFSFSFSTTMDIYHD